MCNHSQNKPLLTIDQVPRYLRYNSYIRSGYRHPADPITSNPILANAYHLWISIFSWHNESCNIWSHLFGLLFFGYLMIYELFFHDAPYIRWCAFLTCCACSITFLLSCLYHAGMNKCKCQSEYNECLNLDVRGILFSSTFTGISPVINGYKCNYPIFVFISVLLLISSMTYCWYKLINDTATAKTRGKYIGWHSVLRTILALSMVCGNMIWHSRYETMWWHGIALLLLGAGGAINVNRYPEKWFVNEYVSSFFLVKDRDRLKKLKKWDCDYKEEYNEWLDYIRNGIDYFGNSHQIFHVFVLLSCITVYYGAVWDELYLQNTVCHSTMLPRMEFIDDGQDKSAFYAVAMELIFEPSFLYPF